MCDGKMTKSEYKSFKSWDQIILCEVFTYN